MPETGKYTFRKNERLCSLKLTEKLFNGGGSHSMVAFPIRLVYTETAPIDGNAPVSLLISVPKKRFKHAVKRNRVKRQLREAFRLHKSTLYQALERDIQQEGIQQEDIHQGSDQKGVAMALIWIDDKLYPTATVERRVANLMERLAEKLQKP